MQLKSIELPENLMNICWEGRVLMEILKNNIDAAENNYSSISRQLDVEREKLRGIIFKLRTKELVDLNNTIGGSVKFSVKNKEKAIAFIADSLETTRLYFINNATYFEDLQEQLIALKKSTEVKK